MSNMSTMSTMSTMSKRLSFKQSKEDCPSICIPRVFKNITIPFIVNIFQKQLKLGLIKKVSSVIIQIIILKKYLFILIFGMIMNLLILLNKKLLMELL